MKIPAIVKNHRIISPAVVVCGLAVLLAATGSATALPGINTVNSGDVVNGSLTGQDIRNDSVRGRDIRERTLGKVPNANKLDGFDSGALRTKAFQSREESVSNIGTSFTVITARSLPRGSYLLLTEADLDNDGPGNSSFNCQIRVGNEVVDELVVDVASTPDDEVIAMQAVVITTSPAAAQLRCSSSNANDDVIAPSLTALKVGATAGAVTVN